VGQPAPLEFFPHDPGDDSRPSSPGERRASSTQDLSLLSLTLSQMTSVERPKVPQIPAPPVTPPRGWEPLPIHLQLQLHELELQKRFGTRTIRSDTMVARSVNSSVGRGIVFALTFILFMYSAVSLTTWHSVQNRLEGKSVRALLIAVCCAIVMFTFLPMLAERAGMSPFETGWKPYLVFYRCSYFMAVPALVCLAMGYGERSAFGESAGPAGALTLGKLSNDYWNYFEASDGFVGLNLTKGVIETLDKTVHGDVESERKSRFRDAELRINTEPFSDVPEPTEPPNMLKAYRIAPIFASWAPCVARYRVSGACLQRNRVEGWALSETRSLCSDLRMVACKPPKPLLEPVYGCSDPDNAVHGGRSVGPIGVGLCGRIIQPPFEGVIDELKALLLSDGWPEISIPNATSLWVDVQPNKCIAAPDDCLNRWSTVGMVGVLFALLTSSCIVVPAALDCVTDYRIRSAANFYMQYQRISEKVRLEMGMQA